MSSEKRLVLFLLVTFVSIVAIQQVSELLGLNPPPAVVKPEVPPEPVADKPEAKDVASDKPKPKDEIAAKKDETAKPAAKEPPAITRPDVPLVNPEELLIGSSNRDQKKDGYLLDVQLGQSGAGVVSVASATYDAEFVEGKPKTRPLHILQRDLLADRSLTLAIRDPKEAAKLGNEPETKDAIARLDAVGAEIPLNGIDWEVVKDEQGPGRSAKTRSEVGKSTDGQEIVFQHKVSAWGLTLTKTFRIWKQEEGFEVDLKFASPEKDRTISYRLLGPHGIPIEGEWYTSTFRDAIFFATGMKDPVTVSAYDIVKNREKPERFLAQPIRFAGVENQYFTSFIEPNPIPTVADDRYDSETLPIVLHVDAENQSKSDIGVEILSKPIVVGPNVTVEHHYKVFAGPKTVESLTPWNAEEIAKYRKSNWIPFAPDIAKMLISPLLKMTYQLTEWVGHLFGRSGNYGVAIILLTMVVRMAMFPLGRKQAMSAKKMQDLQPQMKALQDKYKEDKEALTRETWAIYKRNGVNPVSGCLPALIQMPIFVGLWQALNNSVALRHAHFLYIDNLAAPDMLRKFPFEMPSFLKYYIGDYFNLLPFVVVSLMLVQTKLFSPPPTTPEAEQQQKMMKFMMIFMAFMFYKVPSGLGIYFITSSLWQISERLLLPKAKSPSTQTTDLDGTTDADDDRFPPSGGSGGNNGGGKGPNGTPPKPPGKFGKFWERVLQEAAKDTTVRNLTEEKDRRVPRERENGNDRGRPKPRNRPGKRR